MLSYSLLCQNYSQLVEILKPARVDIYNASMYNDCKDIGHDKIAGRIKIIIHDMGHYLNYCILIMKDGTLRNLNSGYLKMEQLDMPELMRNSIKHWLNRIEDCGRQQRRSLSIKKELLEKVYHPDNSCWMLEC